MTGSSKTYETSSLVQRRYRRSTIGRRNSKRALMLAAVFLVIVGAVGGLLLAVPSDKAAADVFEISRRDGEILLSVVEVVDDPQSIIDQLAEEVGLPAEVFAVPVPEPLVGSIIAVGSLGTLEPTFVGSADGTITEIRLPEDGSGPIIIEYGRLAETGEEFMATIPDERCASFFGLTIDGSLDDLSELASAFQYQLNLPDQTVMTEVRLDEIPTGARIVAISFIEQDKILVEVQIGELPEPRHPRCQPGSE